MISRYTDVDGLRVHHRAAGTGSPLVFVHGLAVSSSYFVPLARELSSTYACAAVDQPGMGASEDTTAVRDIPGLADGLAAWLRDTGLEGAPLIANSMGCQVAAELAVRHPGAAGPLVLIGPTVDPSARSSIRQLARLVNTGMTGDAMQLPLVLRDAVAAGPRRIIVRGRFTLEHRIENVLPQIPQPTLILRGAWDPVAPQRWVQEATALLPQGWFTVVPGGAHLVHLTHYLHTAAIVRRFLAGTAGVARGR